MNSNDVTTTLILSLEEAELYETQNHSGKFITKGTLNIYFILEYNCYILHLNDFNYTLSREIPVLSKPSQGYPEYVFPNLDGFYVIKITKMASFEALSSLETLLNEHCTLAHEVDSGELNMVESAETIEEKAQKERDIQEVQKDIHKDYAKQIEKVKEEKKAGEKTNTEVASTYIASGGEIARAGIIKGAEYVSSGISSVANYLKVNYINKGKEVDLSESQINKVKIVHNASKKFETFTSRQVEAVIKKGKDIAVSVADSASNTDAGKKFESYEHKDTIVEVGKSTLHAVGCIYEGMFEAIEIIGMGLGKDSKDIIEHKYGEKAGTAFSYGFEALSNFSVRGIIRRQMVRLLKKTEPETLKEE